MPQEDDEVKRTIRFDYFETKEIPFDKNGKSKNFNLIQWISTLPTGNLDDRNIRIGDVVRCDNASCEKSNGNNFAYLHFTKLRETNAPAIAKLSDAKLNDLELDDDEFVAEDLSILFDELRYVAMIQKNRYSLSLKAIEDYINYFWSKAGNKDTYIKFLPILYKSQYKKVSHAKQISKIFFRTADLINNEGEGINPFTGKIGSLVGSMKQYEGYNISVQISVGKHTGKTLDVDKVKKLVTEIKDNDQDIAKANIKYIDEDGLPEFTELIKGKISSFLVFSLPKKVSLHPDSVKTSMLAEYFTNTPNKRDYVQANRL